MCSEDEMRFEMLGGKASKGLMPWAFEGCSILERFLLGGRVNAMSRDLGSRTRKGSVHISLRQQATHFRVWLLADSADTAHLYNPGWDCLDFHRVALSQQHCELVRKAESWPYLRSTEGQSAF